MFSFTTFLLTLLLVCGENTIKETTLRKSHSVGWQGQIFHRRCWVSFPIISSRLPTTELRNKTETLKSILIKLQKKNRFRGEGIAQVLAKHAHQWFWTGAAAPNGDSHIFREPHVQCSAKKTHWWWRHMSHSLDYQRSSLVKRLQSIIYILFTQKLSLLPGVGSLWNWKKDTALQSTNSVKLNKGDKRPYPQSERLHSLRRRLRIAVSQSLSLWQRAFSNDSLE